MSLDYPERIVALVDKLGFAELVQRMGSEPKLHKDVLRADLSDFSGDNGELKFRGWEVLDDIKFSPLEVPEPAMWSILLLGGAFLTGFRKRPKNMP